MSADVMRYDSSGGHVSEAWSKEAVVGTMASGTEVMSEAAADLRSKLLRPK